MNLKEPFKLNNKQTNKIIYRIIKLSNHQITKLLEYGTTNNGNNGSGRSHECT